MNPNVVEQELMLFAIAVAKVAVIRLRSETNGEIRALNFRLFSLWPYRLELLFALVGSLSVAGCGVSSFPSSSVLPPVIADASRRVFV